MIKLSDYVAKRLKEHYAVEHLFMVSGGGAMHLNDSFGRYIPYIANHHEQACAIAAEGYARVNQRLAVVNVTTGPGGLNCLNGVFGQWTDSAPVLYISGQVKRQTMLSTYPELPLRQLGDQEVDIVSVVKPLTKYAVTVREPKEIKYHLDKAIYEATSGRFGPVWLDIPIDVQASMIDENELVDVCFSLRSEPMSPTLTLPSRGRECQCPHLSSPLEGEPKSLISKGGINHLYSKKVLDYAIELRKKMTDAENILWYFLRKRQMNGVKFRRQSPMGQYIVDFVSFEKKLVIELDGGHHLSEEQLNHDKLRDEFLKNAGYRVLRFSNTDVFNNVYGVLEFISDNSEVPPTLALPLKGGGDTNAPHPSLFLKGGGDTNAPHPSLFRKEGGDFYTIKLPLCSTNDECDRSSSTIERGGDTDALCGNISSVFEKLAAAERPLIVAGHGIILSKQEKKFYKLLEKLNVPVVSTFNGCGLMRSDDKNFVGTIGTIGQRAGNFALQNADLVLCLGTRNNIRQASYNWENFGKNAFKIVVDIDNAELEKPLVKPDLAIHSDLKDFLPALLDEVENLERPQWLEFCQNLKEKYSFKNTPEYQQTTEKINPYYFTRILTSKLEEDDVLVSANATPSICIFQAGVLNGQRILMNSGDASMGYGLPASIGASLNCKGTTVCFEGDGSIMMNIQELQTIKHNNLPIKIFIINNSGYSSIRQTQKNFFDGHMTGSGTDSGVSVPDFVQVAKAFGLKSVKIENPEMIEEQINEVLGNNAPVVCEVMVEKEYTFTPKLSSRKLEDGTMISPSLEDMFPFLDRNEYEQNIFYK